MKKGTFIGLIGLAIFSIFLLITISWTISVYNDLVQKDTDIDGQWAQVANQYQRKIDLIPALVETVQSYQEFESSTLTNITELRTRWMDAKSPSEQLEISSELDVQLANIVLTYENYPYLQSIVAVSELMVSLEGTENRIATERMRYNEAVKDYNAKIRTFPAVIVASAFGFEKREYFESSAAPNMPGIF